MTTLAEINATLGTTNIALSSVAKEQKETNKGISSFIEFVKSKDTRDRREDLEESREKKASVLSRAAGAASAAGGFALGAGKKGLDLGKGLFGGIGGALGKILPIGIAGAFLTSLLGSKLLRGGIAGLGLMFGDKIAEFLTGPNAKKEVKDMVSGAIKGGSLGFLLGPKFALIGAALGALLTNDKVDQEAGRLLLNLEKLGISFPKLSGLFEGISNAVGSGLESINKLIEGTSEDKAGDIGKAMLLVGGVATLLMPGKMAGLVLALSKRLLMTPAGLAIMAIAGSGAAINMLMGNDVDDPSGFIGSAATAATGYGLYKGIKSKSGLPGVSGSAVSRLPKASVPKAGGQSALARMFGLLKTGAKGAFGLMMSATGAAILVPLAAVGVTETLFGDELREENEQNKQKINALKSSGKTTVQGKEFFTGTRGFMEDFVSGNKLGNVNPVLGGGGAIGMNVDENLDEKYRKKYNTVSNISKLLPKNLVETSMKGFEDFASPAPAINNSGNVVSTNTVNSGNVYNNAGFAINSSGANDPRNMFGTQANNAAGLF